MKKLSKELKAENEQLRNEVAELMYAVQLRDETVKIHCKRIAELEAELRANQNQ